MVIGIPREIKDHEYRVGMTPGGVKTLTQAGHQVLVEQGAGEGSSIPDHEYLEAGATLVPNSEGLYNKAEMIVKVKEPLPREFVLLQKGQILCSFLHLAVSLPLTQALLEKGVCGIAYETVALGHGKFPILKPMSEIAGRLAVQNGAFYLQRSHRGRGVLISGVPGAERGCVVILGGGTVGSNAAWVAVGLGARVIVLDRDVERLRDLEWVFEGRVETEMAHSENINRRVIQADLVIGAVMVAGAKTPKLVDRTVLGRMKKGAVVVDVAIDQGGCFETSHPTTHSDPVYDVDGILHYCVSNMPGAVPRTSTYALANVTLPYIQEIAERGLENALKSNQALRHGLNTYKGRVTHAGVAQAHGLQYEPVIF